MRVGVGVALTVPADLGTPVGIVRSGQRKVVRTSVPVAVFDEDGERAPVRGR